VHLYRYALCFALLPLAAMLPQTAAPDSNQPAPTFQAKARVVVMDVVVTNAKNESVPGLRKEDFEISEDNAPQTIATFEEHHGAPLTQIKLPPMPPGVYTNLPTIQKSDSLNVLLLDSLNTQLRDQGYVHDQMLKYLGTIPPGTRVAIFTLASRLRMLQGVTTDSTEMLAVLHDKSNAAGSHPSQLLPSPAENDAIQHHIDFMEVEEGGHGTPQTQAQAAVDAVSSIKQFLADSAAFQTESRIRLTLEALQQLARYLSDTPGRKNVIWFSGSFPTGILPNSDLPDPSSSVRSFEEEIRRTTDLLASSQVAIYPIAAEGLVGNTIYEANGSEIGPETALL
jgi:VWFA-related protein